MSGEEPEHLLVRACGDTSPLHTTDAWAPTGVRPSPAPSRSTTTPSHCPAAWRTG
ncbi:hypothetical protein RFN58_25940 [Streptomyces iakyrus]|uniref:hypothetical protein n=1 Tax=Streptomyces iakyrus TaxID=68219 RepID=UPI000B1293D4|nr:hypothetical protein [Streptomyces iakyrus]